MKKQCSRWSWLSVWLLLGLVINPAVAETTPAFRAFIEQFLAEHPAAQAAQADLKRAEAQARAFEQPLYNPELEIEYEDAIDITKSVGLNQTFDWNGKRRARDRASNESVRAAAAALAVARLELLADLLEKMSTVKVTEETAQLSNQRVGLLKRFARLAERRHAAGDVGQSDVDLAHLTLSEASMQAATLISEAAEAESRLTALFQPPRSVWPPLPALPLNLSIFDNNVLLEKHPRLLQVKAEATAAKASILVSQRDRRADPTLGLHGGQEADDTMVRLNLSIPLFVRNTFRAEVDAANADAIRSEQTYQDELRRARGELEASSKRYRLLRTAFQDWEQKGKRRLKGRVALLDRLWGAGEIGTIEYLVQLQQTLDTQLSAAALRGAVWEAWIHWLTASGQTEYWLGIQTVPAS